MKIELLYKKFLHSGGISINSQTLKQNQIFIAIHGEKFNANQFALSAIEKGAMYAIVDDVEYKTHPSIIVVENGLKTLQELASYHRNQSKSKVLALTGSNGKTTTKELINVVLSSKYNTAATKGNLNNHIGVPLSLLEIQNDTEISIIEMGANHLKEVEFLCNIAKPNFGYITNFGKAHLEGFGNIEGVIKGKSEMYNHLKKYNEIIFYNISDSIQKENCSKYQNSVAISDILSFSTRENGFLNIFWQNCIIKTNLIGDYNVSNINAAIKIGAYFKISEQAIKTAIEGYIPKNNRSQMIKIGSLKIILDAYNANPSSVKVAIDNFSNLKDNKLAILGDMLELGNHSVNEHQKIVDQLQKYGIKALLVGKEFSKTNTTYPKFVEYSDVENYLKKEYLKQTTLLLKGSRKMNLEKLIDFLKVTN